MRRIIRGLSLAIVLWATGFSLPQSGSLYAAAATGSPAIEPYFVRQAEFSIPYDVKEAAGQALEVQLFVSRDSGSTWQLYHRQRPGESPYFLFRAPEDGRYWFASRTVAAPDTAPPRGPLAPQMLVVVDTRKPELEVSAGPGPGGDILTTLRAADENLDPQSIAVEYQNHPSAPWKRVKIDRLDPRGSELRGESSWWPEDARGDILVRVVVHDRAGNPAVIERRVLVPHVASRGQQLAGTGASGSATPTGSRAPAELPRTGNVNQWPADAHSDFAGPGRQLPAPGGSAGPMQPPTRVAGIYTPGGPPAPPNHLAGTAGAGASAVAPANSQGLSAAMRAATDPSMSHNGAERGGSGYPPVRSEVQPPVADQVSGSAAGLPSGELPRMTNARRFELDYDVQSVGPGGVAEVELWVTRDGGRSWDRWGTDTDRQSPFEVVVETEGTYGFRLVVISQSGLAGRPPEPGDPADVWVGVDLTEPTAEITAVTYGEGEYAGMLQIHWQAGDAHLAPRPVSLLFRDRPDGAWSPVASGLDNTGLYNWRPDPSMAHQVYLRLEVRDEAGNVAAYDLNEPISLEALVPKAHIRSIRPVTSEERQARRPFWQR